MSVREVRDWDLGLLLELLLLVVVLLLVSLPLLVVATEGLRGQTRGAVDRGKGTRRAKIVSVPVDVLIQIPGPHAPWAHRHWVEEIHYKQKHRHTKTKGNMCTRVLYPLSVLFPNILSFGYTCTR